MKILVIAAHPDDEILGLGGTINKYIRNKHEVYIHIVTDGSSSQYPNDLQKKELKSKDIKKVKEFLKIKDIIHGELPDMKLDTLPQIEINNEISKVLLKIKPDIVYTHHKDDVNKDHQIIYEATMVACRPVNDFLKEIYSYEVLSATGWNGDNLFVPNTYIELKKEDIVNKMQALELYKTEIREYPHPRSKDAVLNLSKFRGNTIVCEYAEAFQLIRKIERN